MQNCLMPLLSRSIHAVIECPHNDTQTVIGFVRRHSLRFPDVLQASSLPLSLLDSSSIDYNIG